MMSFVISLNLLLWIVVFGGFESYANILLIKLGGGLLVSLIFSHMIIEVVNSNQILAGKTTLTKRAVAHTLGAILGFPLVLLTIQLSFRLGA